MAACAVQSSPDYGPGIDDRLELSRERGCRLAVGVGAGAGQGDGYTLADRETGRGHSGPRNLLENFSKLWIEKMVRLSLSH